MILRPVYPLKVFRVLQLAKTCNIRSKSVICGEHPSGIIPPDTMKIWTTVCMIPVYSTKSNSVGGVDFLSFTCGHDLQASGQCPGKRNCVYTTKVKATIMKTCKLYTYKNICERISCCQGQVQFSYHFTHYDIGHRDLLFQSSCLWLVFLCWWKMPSHSLMFLLNWDLICFRQSYWPLWAQEKSFLQSLQNTWCSPFDSLRMDLKTLFLSFHF